MTTLVTGDLHLAANPRDYYRLDFLHEKLPSLIQKYKVDEVYILGDICEVKDEHSSFLVNAVVDGIAKIHEMAAVTYLMGNHDYVQAGEPFFRFLHNIPGLIYIHKPYKKNKLYFLPFTRNPARDWKKLDFKGVRRIFTHVTFDGADGGWTKLEGIPRNLLPDLPIISGDVHVPQQIGNVFYVGAPYTVDFGDKYTGRVLIFGDDMTGVKSVTVGGAQKRLIRAPHLTGCKTGDIVRVEMPLKSAEYAKWQEKVKEIQLWAAETGVKLDSVVPIITDNGKVDSNKEMPRKSAVNDEQVLDAYGKAKQIDEKTMKTGKKLL